MHYCGKRRSNKRTRYEYQGCVQADQRENGTLHTQKASKDRQIGRRVRGNPPWPVKGIGRLGAWSLAIDRDGISCGERRRRVPAHRVSVFAPTENHARSSTKHSLVGVLLATVQGPAHFSVLAAASGAPRQARSSECNPLATKQPSRKLVVWWTNRCCPLRRRPHGRANPPQLLVVDNHEPHSLVRFVVCV